MHRLLTEGLVVGLAVLAGCGDDSTDPVEGDATRTVDIDMVDIAFEPDTLDISAGETVRFVFTNTGEVPHEAFIGDADEQDEHETEMREAAGNEHGHGQEDVDAVTVEPGDTAELSHTFDEPGRLEIGCHEEGHYDAGMTITVEVA